VAALVEGISHVLVALVFAGEFLVSVSLQIAVVRGRACVNFAHVGFVAAQDRRPDPVTLAAHPPQGHDSSWLFHARTNTADLAPAEVVKRYKSLADIERGFRVLKSEIEIGPIYHRLPTRIRAHAAICFMALILYRVMRSRLRASDSQLSPERALSKLRRIQHQRITLNNSQPIAGLSSITQEHTDILSALTIKKPTLDTQLTLL